MSSLPLLPELVIVHQPVTASLNIGPTATIPTQFPSGANLKFTTGTPAAQVCSGSRPMHVEYVSYTGSTDSCGP